MPSVAALLDQLSPGLWGMCPFETVKDHLIDCRGRQRLPPNARTLFCFVFPYRTEHRRHNVSRYAIVPDYHRALSSFFDDAVEVLLRQYPNRRFVPFIDNSPIPEVFAACACGLGRRGDQGLFFHPLYGSWVFLGEIVTDLLSDAVAHPIEHCLHCGKCRKACPSGALQGGFVKERCLSYLTQKKGDLTQQQRQWICQNKLAWGCDVCQEVCPLNADVEIAPHPLLSANAVPNITLNKLDQYRDRAFFWRPKSVLERNLRILACPKSHTTDE